MFGKIFNDIFDSTVSEFGGDTMYVLMCMVVLSDAKGFLRMTPLTLARRIRKDLDVVNRALINLEAKDPDSGSPDYEGRRLVKLTELTQGQENRGWLLVNKVKYAGIRSEAMRNHQNQEKQQRYRDKKKENTLGSNDPKNVTGRYGSLLSLPHKDKDEDKDKYKTKELGQKNNFDRFWSNYPKKVKRKEAVEVWKRKKLDSRTDELIADVALRVQSDDAWLNGFIPHPTTYLRGERWNDELQKPEPKALEMNSSSQVLRVGAQKGLSPRPGESMDDYEARVRGVRHGS